MVGSYWTRQARSHAGLWGMGWGWWKGRGVASVATWPFYNFSAKGQCVQCNCPIQTVRWFLPFLPFWVHYELKPLEKTGAKIRYWLGCFLRGRFSVWSPCLARWEWYWGQEVSGPLLTSCALILVCATLLWHSSVFSAPFLFHLILLFLSTLTSAVAYFPSLSMVSCCSLLIFFSVSFSLCRRLKFGKPGGPFLSFSRSSATLLRWHWASYNIFVSKFPYLRGRG